MKTLLLLALPLVSAFVLPLETDKSDGDRVYTLPYSDANARKKMLFAAGGAYGTTPQSCLDKAFTGASIRRIVTARCDVDPKDKCVGYTAVSPADKAILVVFRGTTGNAQLVLEGLGTVFEYHVSELLVFGVLMIRFRLHGLPVELFRNTSTMAS